MLELGRVLEPVMRLRSASGGNPLTPTQRQQLGELFDQLNHGDVEYALAKLQPLFLTNKLVEANKAIEVISR